MHLLGDPVVPQVLALAQRSPFAEVREMAALVLLNVGRPPSWSVVDLLPAT